jgi:hypothetical protein
MPSPYPERARRSERRRAEPGADHGPPAARLEVKHARAERGARGVAAVVQHARVGVELGRDAGGARAQAQVEVLVEQEGAGVEGAEPAQELGARGEAGGDRPAHAARTLGAPGLEALAQRPRQRARRHERGDQRGGAGERVGAVLRRAVGVQQAGGEQRVAAGGAPRERGERIVDQLAVGVQEHRDAGPGEPQPGVAGGAEARVAVEPDDVRAARGGEVGAAVGRAAVGDHDLRRRVEVTLDRIEQRGEVRPRVVDDDDRGERHRAAALSSTACIACAERVQS